MAVTTLTEERALSLLGSGVSAEQTASACGVTPSYISQLLSDAEFAGAVAEARYNNLARHNALDDKYEDLESKLLQTLSDVRPLLTRPMEILKAISVINNAKRRGSSAPANITPQNTVVQLVMPTVLMQKFQVNINNQVLVAGEQTLQTIQSSSLLNGRSTNPQDILAAQQLAALPNKDANHDTLQTVAYSNSST